MGLAHKDLLEHLRPTLKRHTAFEEAAAAVAAIEAAEAEAAAAGLPAEDSDSDDGGESARRGSDGEREGACLRQNRLLLPGCNPFSAGLHVPCRKGWFPNVVVGSPPPEAAIKTVRRTAAGMQAEYVQGCDTIYLAVPYTGTAAQDGAADEAASVSGMTDDDEDAVRVLSRGAVREAEVDPDFERELAELLLEPKEAGPPSSSGGVPSAGEGQVKNSP